MDNKTEQVVLPGGLQLNQVCFLQFRKEDNPFTATIVGINFHKGTVKYDLSLFWVDETFEIQEQETRIYNVHSKYLTPA